MELRDLLTRSPKDMSDEELKEALRLSKTSKLTKSAVTKSTKTPKVKVKDPTLVAIEALAKKTNKTVEEVMAAMKAMTEEDSNAESSD